VISHTLCNIKNFGVIVFLVIAHCFAIHRSVESPRSSIALKINSGVASCAPNLSEKLA